MWLMFAVLLIAWVHGCIGLYFWLRMKAFYKRARAVSARGGGPGSDAGACSASIRAAGASSTTATAPNGGRKIFRRARSAPRPQQDVLEDITDYFLIGYLGLLGLVLLARGVRALNERRGGMISLSYGNGRTVRVPKGLQRARGEPALQRPACQRLRRPRPLLHLPHSRDRRLQRAAGAVAARGVRAQPGRRVRPVDPSRLPAPAGDRSVVLPALHAADDVGECARLAAAPHRPGALSGQHVRGHARLDQARRKPAAVRHRLHRQPFPRRGVAGRDRMRRPAQPVRRRRTNWRCSGLRPARKPPAARRSGRRR